MEIRFKQNDIALEIVFNSENFVYQFFCGEGCDVEWVGVIGLVNDHR